MKGYWCESQDAATDSLHSMIRLGMFDGTYVTSSHDVTRNYIADPQCRIGLAAGKDHVRNSSSTVYLQGKTGRAKQTKIKMSGIY